jgi:cyclic pyranopterin phosphate synthase
MGETVIPLADLRYTAPVPAIPAQAIPATGLLADALGRPLRDLRISVTDRCNFRCSYCMPKEVFDGTTCSCRTSSLLSFEEITRAGAHLRRPRRAQAAPDRRRAAAAQGARVADRDAGRPAHARWRALDITLTTNGIGAGAQGRRR